MNPEMQGRHETESQKLSADPQSDKLGWQCLAKIWTTPNRYPQEIPQMLYLQMSDTIAKANTQITRTIYLLEKSETPLQNSPRKTILSEAQEKDIKNSQVP